METKDKIYDFISIGGGAAGFFGAINVQKLSSKDLKVAIVESSSSYLRKVKISGGGRCNVTNACTNPKELIQNYPRGGRNLLNSFYSFGTEDMVSWLSENGVATHTEADGRMFPRSNKSETIIKCFIKLCEKHRVEILGSTPILSITKEESFFLLKSKDSSLKSKQILIATGSSAKGHSLIKDLGHEITPLAPSLFTFKCSHPIINGLPGTSLQSASLTLEVEGKKFKQIGPILITHWGFSGPAVLKLSAFAARELKKSAYKATLKINWCDQLSEEEIYQKLKKEKSLNSKKQAHNSKLFNFSKRFWERICELNKLKQKSWGETSDKDLRKLSHFLNQERYKVAGKGEFKDEFVTCGGVSLKEINLNSFESKIHPGLYFAGEVLDVDGITGGFNFQNAWSSSYQVAKAVTKSN